MVAVQHAVVTRGTTERIRRLERAESSTDAVDAHVGGQLRARRVELGLSQVALGRRLGLTFSQVQKYEKGSNRIGAGRLYHLASILGVPVQYFFEGLDEEGAAPRRSAAGVAAADGARLQDAFARIADPQARQALLALASSLGED